MNPETSGTAPERAPSFPALYRAVWRWHFYAGLVVVPFLLVFAVTGLIMVYGNSVETFLGERYPVTPGGTRLGVVAQARAAEAAIAGGTLRLYVHPADDARASVFLVAADGKDHVVSVDPHDGRILGTIVKDDSWFYWADHIHGTLLLGDFGDRLQEIAAGLGIVLVLTGLTLWWPRNGRGWAQALLPNLALRGRALWRQLHMSFGFYFAIVLLFFLVSGMAWTGIWGTRIVQAWSALPAEKLGNVPLSDKTHASMNHGAMKRCLGRWSRRRCWSPARRPAGRAFRWARRSISIRSRPMRARPASTASSASTCPMVRMASTRSRRIPWTGIRTTRWATGRCTSIGTAARCWPTSASPITASAARRWRSASPCIRLISVSGTRS
jgi:uncharacterized iron-regulated membrane protein